MEKWTGKLCCFSSTLRLQWLLSLLPTRGRNASKLAFWAVQDPNWTPPWRDRDLSMYFKSTGTRSTGIRQSGASFSHMNRILDLQDIFDAWRLQDIIAKPSCCFSFATTLSCFRHFSTVIPTQTRQFLESHDFQARSYWLMDSYHNSAANSMSHSHLTPCEYHSYWRKKARYQKIILYLAGMKSKSMQCQVIVRPNGFSLGSFMVFLPHRTRHF